VSLSLDAWTSSNGHAFLAIVMHWINGDWKLGTPNFLILITCLLNNSTISEELLIDFRELVGNIWVRIWAHAVYDTLNIYGLKGRVSL